MTSNPIETSKKKRRRDEIEYRLFRNHPWLENYTEPLTCLLDCFLGNDDEFIAELVDRFCYLDYTSIHEHVKKIANHIVGDIALDASTTALVSASADASPDSGQMVAGLLKPMLAAKNWYPRGFSVQFGKAIKLSENVTDIVIIDEFAGTGQTIIGRIEHMRRGREQKGISNNIKIHVCLIAAICDAEERIKGHTDSFYCGLVLPKGIRDNWRGDERCTRYELMRAFEAQLDGTRGRKPLPSLGYGRAEALYCAGTWNIPNSCFPIFWWRYHKTKRKWLPLFNRFDENFFGG